MVNWGSEIIRGAWEYSICDGLVKWFVVWTTLRYPKEAEDKKNGLGRDLCPYQSQSSRVEKIRNKKQKHV